VPNVIGLSRAKAQSEIIAAGLVIGKITEVSSSNVRTGVVLSQNPADGTSAAMGTAVNLVISAGPAMLQVPDVVGLTQEEAQTEITVAELKIGTVARTNSPTVPVGKVISQNPAAGSSVVKGSSVDLMVSSGAP
jgi:beta-lactam-binding protein with PASTA domain